MVAMETRDSGDFARGFMMPCRDAGLQAPAPGAAGFPAANFMHCGMRCACYPEQNMKILYLAPQPFFRERGTPLRTRTIITALTEAGHDVDLLCLPFGQEVTLPRLRMFRTPRLPGIRDISVGPSVPKILMDGVMFLQAFFMCLRRRYEVIQCVEEAGFFGTWLARLFRIPLIYNMDSYASEQLIFSGFARRGPILWLARRLERAAMVTALGVVTVGPLHAREVRRFAPQTRVVELQDAPMSDRFVEDTAGAQALRAELGLGDAPAIVYTGNFEPYQGVDILVRAAGILAPRYPRLRIVMAGGEPKQIEALRARAASCGAAEACVFAGRRPPEQMAAFTTMASILVTPRNRGANPPMKLYPYMQSGRPIVAARVPTHTQVLDDSCAFLVEPDPESLAAGIREAWEHPDEARRRADAARARVDERYSLAIFKQKIRDLMAHVAAAKRNA